MAQITERGGISGITREGLLGFALARPEHRAHCGEAELATLAAVYACGIVRDHPILEGNKGTAFVTMELFLIKNGFKLAASDDDAVVTFLRMAAGDISEEELGVWIRPSMEAPDP